jgi:hypothetical protein
VRFMLISEGNKSLLRQRHKQVSKNNEKYRKKTIE